MNRRIIVVFAVSILTAYFTGAAAAQLPQLLYLPFNEGSGSATADLAQPGIPSTNAMLTEASNWNTTSPYLGSAHWEPTTAAPGSVDLGTTSGLTGAFTLEFAIKPFEPSSAPSSLLYPNPIFSTSYLGQHMSCHLYPSNQDDKYRLFLTVPGEFQRFISPPIPLYEWTSVAVVYYPGPNGVGLILTYLNGEFVYIFAIYTPVAISGSSTTWRIGGSSSNSLQNWRGAIDEVRLWNTSRHPALIRALVRSEVKNLDFAVGDITSPPRRLNRLQYYGNAETVSVDVCNPGQVTIPVGTVIPMTLEVDGVAVATEYYATQTDMQPGDVDSFTFAATADLTGFGVHTIRVVAGFADDSPVNNDLALDFRGGGLDVVDSLPWREHFDGGTLEPPLYIPPGNTGINAMPREWEAVPAQGWFHFSLATQGIPDRSGGGQYITSQVGTLSTPVVELLNATSPELSFWMTRGNVFNLTPGQFWVDVTSLSTGVTTTVLGPLGSIAGGYPTWEQHHVDLTPFVGDAVLIQFRITPGAYQIAFALDDVAVVDLATPSEGGQAPRAGLASLDIDEATNLYEHGVDSLEAGPYRRRSRPTRPLDIVVKGQPFQPFILFSADLNVAAATYGAAGQIDCGGIPDPMTGIPAGLVTWGNGFSPQNPVDLLFFLDANGEAVLPTQMPSLSIPGGGAYESGDPLATFQIAAAVSGPPYIALSNAVELVFF